MTHPMMGSSPSYLSPSPIRSSPLTAPPHFSPTRSPSPSTSLSACRLTESTSAPIPSIRRFSQPSSSNRRPSRSLLVPFTPASPPTTSPHPASPPLSRSQPLLGSYQLSLLHSRMSRTQSHSVASSSTAGFSLRIGAVGKGKSCPAHLRAPLPLTLPFSATYYDLLDPTEGRRDGAAQTPWVGNIDLEQVYFDKYSSRSPSPEGGVVELPPDHPGYEVAPIGQLQIIVKSSTAPLRVFIIPYDLRHLSLGSRLLIRERTFVENSQEGETSKLTSAQTKEYLRYAIQLQFTCQPSYPTPSDIPSESSTIRRPRQSAPAAPSRLDGDQFFARRYYLSKSLKVIFSASAPSSTERVRTERDDEVVPPSDVFLGSAGRVVGFSPASMGRRGAEEWEMVKQKYIARRKVQEVGVSKEETGNIISPTAISAPLPIIHFAVPSRSTTPIIEPFQRVLSPPPGAVGASLLQASRPQSGTRKAKRQGSGSLAERELSEQLRQMDMRGD